MQLLFLAAGLCPEIVGSIARTAFIYTIYTLASEQVRFRMITDEQNHVVGKLLKLSSTLLTPPTNPIRLGQQGQNTVVIARALLLHEAMLYSVVDKRKRKTQANNQ